MKRRNIISSEFSEIIQFLISRINFNVAEVWVLLIFKGSNLVIVFFFFKRTPAVIFFLIVGLIYIHTYIRMYFAKYVRFFVQNFLIYFFDNEFPVYVYCCQLTLHKNL